jgi:hypothetical protein
MKRGGLLSECIEGRFRWTVGWLEEHAACYGVNLAFAVFEGLVLGCYFDRM